MKRTTILGVILALILISMPFTSSVMTVEESVVDETSIEITDVSFDDALIIIKVENQGSHDENVTLRISMTNWFIQPPIIPVILGLYDLSIQSSDSIYVNHSFLGLGFVLLSIRVWNDSEILDSVSVKSFWLFSKGIIFRIKWG